MKLRKNIKTGFFAISVFFPLIFLFTTVSFAAPGIKITKPINGSTVTPGQQITVTVEAVDGFTPKQGVAEITNSAPSVHIKSLPLTFTGKISMEAAGETTINAVATDASKKLAIDTITLKVQQTATLESLEINQNGIWVDVDWDGNIKTNGSQSGSIVSIFGNYSDGITRDVTNEPVTIYTSSDPSIISVDNKGNYQVYKVGQAAITVSNSGVSKTIPLTFHKPRGIKPSQTVPPTTQISIQPSANAAGWYNKNITITINAQAHEPDVVQEISYRFPYINARPIDVNGSPAVIPFSTEGINPFSYAAYDNERNSSGWQSLTIQLDKTPPTVSLSLNPYTLKLPFKIDNHYFLLPFFYKLSYSATDKLSGVKSVSVGLIIPDISRYKTQLIKRSGFQVILNEKTRHVIIASPNPKETLAQLKTNKIVPIDNNQIMHLNEREKLNTWTIIKIGSYLVINAPSITFKAVAHDNTDNVATKEIKYTKKAMPLPNYVKILIGKKELSPEDIDGIEDDAIIDMDTMNVIRKNYKKSSNN